MGHTYVFYNPLSGDGRVLEDLDALEFVLDETCVFCDMTKPETYGESLFAMEAEDTLLLCGGDGTLHRFVNLTQELDLPNPIDYYPAGDHNDFARDFGRSYGCNPFSVTKALRQLPTVAATIMNKTDPKSSGYWWMGKTMLMPRCTLLLFWQAAIVTVGWYQTQAAAVRTATCPVC